MEWYENQGLAVTAKGNKMELSMKYSSSSVNRFG